MRHILLCVRLTVRRPRVALLGVREFRSDLTTHYDYPEVESYDAGRELAHMLTFRHYDPTRY